MRPSPRCIMTDVYLHTIFTHLKPIDIISFIVWGRAEVLCGVGVSELCARWEMGVLWWRIPPRMSRASIATSRSSCAGGGGAARGPRLHEKPDDAPGTEVLHTPEACCHAMIWRAARRRRREGRRV